MSSRALIFKSGALVSTNRDGSDLGKISGPFFKKILLSGFGSKKSRFRITHSTLLYKKCSQT